MRIEKGNTNIFRITLSGYELAALVSSARWISEGAVGTISDHAIENINEVLHSYDDERIKLEEKAAYKTRFKMRQE